MARTEQGRRHARYDVEGVQGSFLFTIGVDVRNLSIAGMALETGRALNVGRRYTFNITSGEENLRIPGRVMWCVLGSGRKDNGGGIKPVFQAGVRFEDVITETSGDLLHLIEESAVLDVEQRVFGRFHPGTAEVTMHSGLQFTVCRISVGGMLVELRGLEHSFAHVNAVVPLELELGGQHFSAQGRVAFVNNGSGTGRLAGRTEIGLEFVDVDPEQRLIVEKYVAAVVEGEAVEA